MTDPRSPSPVDALPAAREEVLLNALLDYRAAVVGTENARGTPDLRFAVTAEQTAREAVLRSLRLQPAAPMPVGLTEAQIEEIASSWDECHIDSPGGEIEVGPALRRQLRAIAQGWA